MKYLTRKDELLLLAALRLGENAYLVTIMEQLNNTTEKNWSFGNVFVTLDRLHNLGYLETTIGKPHSRRGGKAIKYYRLTTEGFEALKKVKLIQDQMWKGLHSAVFER